MLTGNWTNFEELENNLTLTELEFMVMASRKKEHRHNKFIAAMKGVDIGEYDKQEEKETVEDITHRTKIRAAARLRGMNPEEYELRSLGFGVD
jgi:hypothetical protein